MSSGLLTSTSNTETQVTSLQVQEQLILQQLNATSVFFPSMFKGFSNSFRTGTGVDVALHTDKTKVLVARDPSTPFQKGATISVPEMELVKIQNVGDGSRPAPQFVQNTNYTVTLNQLRRAVIAQTDAGMAVDAFGLLDKYTEKMMPALGEDFDLSIFSLFASITNSVGGGATESISHRLIEQAKQELLENRGISNYDQDEVYLVCLPATAGTLRQQSNEYQVYGEKGVENRDSFLLKGKPAGVTILTHVNVPVVNGVQQALLFTKELFLTAIGFDPKLEEYRDYERGADVKQRSFFYGVSIANQTRSGRLLTISPNV